MLSRRGFLPSDQPVWTLCALAHLALQQTSTLHTLSSTFFFFFFFVLIPFSICIALSIFLLFLLLLFTFFKSFFHSSPFYSAHSHSFIRSFTLFLTSLLFLCCIHSIYSHRPKDPQQTPWRSKLLLLISYTHLPPLRKPLLSILPKLLQSTPSSTYLPLL